MRIPLLFLTLALAFQPAPKPSNYPITPVPLADVQITGGFWKTRLETNRTVTIPHIMRQNELTGRIDNFLKAAHKITGEYKGQRYNDTDVYKIIEAASYSLVSHPDPALDKKLDDLIAIVAAAQEPDGYLYTPRSVDPKNPAPGAGPERWSYLHTSHELYDMGHMMEAAVAHFQATGKRTLLNVAIKAADLMVTVFGPDKRRDVPGHEEVELALVKLSRATADVKYLQLARFFLDERGRQHSNPPVQFEAGSRFAMYNDLAYRQDHIPVAEQTRAVGHAVRATYLYNAMTDVATMLGVPGFARTVEGAYVDIISKRMYVTGGLGSEGRTEAFGDDYVLPNKAYAETCASIGGMLWYHRMFLRTGDAVFLGTFERTLYNGYLSGVSLTGDKFFYQNPLISDGKPERAEYFDVACCPANLARFMAQLPGLLYATRGDELFVNLFVASEAKAKIGSTPVQISQETKYPWDGTVKIRVDPSTPVTGTVSIRVPEWAAQQRGASGLYALNRPSSFGYGVNGAKVARFRGENGYLRITRRWQKGDVVTVEMSMPISRVFANYSVAENRHKAAIQRGPIVYCVEAIDNGGKASNITLPQNAELTASFDPNLLGGVTVIRGNGVTAIPYFAWNNRGKGEMEVWIPYGQ
jgi:uncharacterized protein